MAYAGFGPLVGQALQTVSQFTSVPYDLNVLALNVMACKQAQAAPTTLRSHCASHANFCLCVVAGIAF